MAKFIHIARKLRLIAANRRTRWAPFWTVPKIYGTGRRVHPGRHTETKRSWRRTKLRV
ncbi:50S ribosomal protein L39e [Candidatus Woesearchaeota archaeon]|nr:50S ribosomal protein L39e [Candidatus Woesearchaeota archaeon]